MARARNLKPGFFLNEDLVELPFEVRLLFAGLWTLADREGRLEDRPAKIKMAVFPADSVDVDAGLNLLAERKLITRYVVETKRYIQITNFAKHQNPHVKEAASVIPAPGEHKASTVQATPLTSSLNPDSPFSESVYASPARVNPAATEENSFVTDVLDAVRESFGLLQLSKEFEWADAALWAYVNKFTVENFVECLQLLRAQKWRSGAVRADHVVTNLPSLEKLRTEVEQQDGSTKKHQHRGRRTDAEVLAESQDFYDNYIA